MPDTIYDFAIVGAGAAGLQLAMAMMQQSWLQGKSVLILEKQDKSLDEKTWCFWEKGAGKWDHLLSKSWDAGKFITPKKEINFLLAPYCYKMLRAKDFNRFCQNKVEKHPDFYWKKEEILTIQHQPDNLLVLHGESGKQWRAHRVFDSRIPQEFWKEEDQYLRLLQHFKGWEIMTDAPVFDPEVFSMMDYRVKWKNSTSFTYVLPLTSQRALIEFTLFTPDLIKDTEYDQALKNYIQHILKVKDYQIKRVEQGIIPMTTFPFHTIDHPEGVIRIGTAGGWVKPSTGYSFKNTERQIAILLKNLQHGNPLQKGLIRLRPRYMDAILLDILVKRNELGEKIFTELYEGNSIQQIFKFLDEKTSFLEDMRIATSLQPLPFLKALGNQVFTLPSSLFSV